MCGYGLYVSKGVDAFDRYNALLYRYSWLIDKGCIVAGLVVGVFFYVAAIVTGGQIGKADGILLGILVMAWPPWNGVLFIVYSFLYSFVAAVLLVAIWRKGRNTRMPMVPFMWLGYITVLCL